MIFSVEMTLKSAALDVTEVYKGEDEGVRGRAGGGGGGGGGGGSDSGGGAATETAPDERNDI